MILGSFWRSDPAAAFLGFAKRGLPDSSSESFKSSKDCSGKNTSPLTSRVFGRFFPESSIGTDLMVLIFKVTSSPVVPFPLVNALLNRPSS